MTRGVPRVLITGCHGFIGSHLVRGAARHGYEVIGVDHVGPRDGDAQAPGWVQCDLTSPTAPETIAEAVGSVDAVVHTAARVQLFGFRRPIVRDNVASTANVLASARRSGAPKVIFYSSASVLFGLGDQINLREDAAFERPALNGYAASKRAGEELVRGYEGPWAIFRPQAVIGARDRTLMPPILRAARSGKWSWIGPKDRAHVDLLSVDNLVDWTYACAKGTDATGVFHLSDGDARSIEGLFRQIFEGLGVEVGEKRISRAAALAAAAAVEWPMRMLMPRTEPPITRFGVEVLTRSRTVDTTRACRILGAPGISFEQGLQRMLASHGS